MIKNNMFKINLLLVIVFVFSGCVPFFANQYSNQNWDMSGDVYRMGAQQSTSTICTCESISNIDNSYADGDILMGWQGANMPLCQICLVENVEQPFTL